MNPLDQTLVKITSLLENNHVPYMIIGGYAVSIHGEPRMTQDIDVTLGVDSGFFPQLKSFLTNGFEFVNANPEQFAAETNVVLIRDKGNGIRVDLIFSFIPFERIAINEAIEFNIGQQVVKVASPENLIIYKLLSSRPRDVEDARNVYLCNKTEIDTETISSRLADLSGWLQNDALNVWRNILDER